MRELVSKGSDPFFSYAVNSLVELSELPMYLVS